MLSIYAGSGVNVTVGASGARLPNVMVAEPEALAELPSVTVTSQVITSPREDTEELIETEEPVPKDAPVVVLVHVYASVNVCESASVAVTEQVKESLL